MNKYEFEQFVLDNGKDILRFCRITAGNEEMGNELYQDTMLKLLEKCNKLEKQQNIKSYAISVSIFLWKNQKKKFAIRNKIINFTSLDKMQEEQGEIICDMNGVSAEQDVLSQLEKETISRIIAELPEKYRMPLYLNYSANMKQEEIANVLKIPLGTVKTRIRKAKEELKDRLEAIGYE